MITSFGNFASCDATDVVKCVRVAIHFFLEKTKVK